MSTMISRLAIFTLLAGLTLPANAQEPVKQSQLGAWYMYMWSTLFGDGSFGLQGDVQHRNWDMYGDLEQLLVRGGATWSPRGSSIRYTLGLANVSTGTYGASRDTTKENRIYQEALIPQRIGERLYVTHRFRLEQRWLEGQDMRNRIRYFLSMNYPLNQETLGKGAYYVSFYNEIFYNLENGDVGKRSRQEVNWFDRNRAYLAMGYSMSDTMRWQFGYMYQESSTIGKGQLQLSLVHNF